MQHDIARLQANRPIALTVLKYPSLRVSTMNWDFLT